jgi:hypothetical protein
MPQRRMEEYYTPAELSLAVTRGTILTRPSKAHPGQGLTTHSNLGC